MDYVPIASSLGGQTAPKCWPVVAAWSIGAAGESAWQNAGHVWPRRTIPPLEGRFMDMLDGLTTAIGKALPVPVRLRRLNLRSDSADKRLV
jgi:hypothetical protein